MREITVTLPTHQYQILIQAGIRHTLGERARRAGLAGRPVLMSDSKVFELYGDDFIASLRESGYDPLIHTVAPGEGSKSMVELERAWESMAAAAIDRRGWIVALGGGVVGDLAGFAAATYLRGIRLVQAPTTLLAQVDSSVGGKTGIDLRAGKNLAGAFCHPLLVLADSGCLATLPPREWAAGLAEVVKYGVILDESLFHLLDVNSAALMRHESGILDQVVARCCELKARVVEADEREEGLRSILNYGHTVGHAIEAAAGYGEYLHGEAVSIGMAAAGRLSRAVGLPMEHETRIRALLQQFGLPLELREKLPADRLVSAMMRDKKSQDGRLRFVLARRIGEVVLREVEESDARAALDTIQPGGAAA